MVTTFFTSAKKCVRLTSYTAEIVKIVKTKFTYPSDSDFWMKDNAFKNINTTTECSLSSIDTAIAVHKKNLNRQIENYRIRAYL